MSIDTLGVFTILSAAAAGFAIGVVVAGARVSGLRARNKRIVKAMRLALYGLEMNRAKWQVMNTLRDALDKDAQIAIAIQEGFPETFGDWPNVPKD